MLEFKLDEFEGILRLHPHGELTETDFVLLTRKVDSYLEHHKKLLGVLVVSQDFPGWESFGAMIEHASFVYSHHQKISRVALVTDSVIADIVPLIANHFLDAEIRDFDFAQERDALAWIRGDLREG